MLSPHLLRHGRCRIQQLLRPSWRPASGSSSSSSTTTRRGKRPTGRFPGMKDRIAAELAELGHHELGRRRIASGHQAATRGEASSTSGGASPGFGAKGQARRDASSTPHGRRPLKKGQGQPPPRHPRGVNPGRGTRGRKTSWRDMLQQRLDNKGDGPEGPAPRGRQGGRQHGGQGQGQGQGRGQGQGQGQGGRQQQHGGGRQHQQHPQGRRFPQHQRQQRQHQQHAYDRMSQSTRAFADAKHGGGGQASAAEVRTVELDGTALTVKDLAGKMHVKVNKVLKKLKGLGAERSAWANRKGAGLVNADTAELVVAEFGMDVDRTSAAQGDLVKTRYRPGDSAKDVGAKELRPRWPIVAVMGHVNHGKTTLLDCIRQANVASGEAGGITQSMGAFEVVLRTQAAEPDAEQSGAPPPNKATFLDTPGHAAFAAMRSRGAEVTDVVVLVVAATEGVKEQTVETLEKIRETQIPVVLALTKVDLLSPQERQEAREKVDRDLMSHGLASEEMGGEVQVVEVCGTTGAGLAALEEALLLQTEMMELEADYEAAGEAIVLESENAQGLGYVADALVRWGTLRLGDVVVAGTEWGRVRGLLNSVGEAMEEAPPMTPVRVVGMRGLVPVGVDLLTAKDEEHAKEIVELREALEAKSEARRASRDQDRQRQQAVAEQRAARRAEAAAGGRRRRGRLLAAPSEDKYEAMRVSLLAKLKPEVFEDEDEDEDEDGLGGSTTAAADDAKDDDEVPVASAVIKADSEGSLQTILDEIASLPSSKIRLQVVHQGLGAVTQRDVFMCATHSGAIFGMNSKPNKRLERAAEVEGVPLSNHTLVHELMADVTSYMEQQLEPIFEERILGQASIEQVITLNKRAARGTFDVAGCKVTSGSIKRNSTLRLVRGKNEVFRTAKGAASMKHFKDDVAEVQQGKEFAIGLHGEPEYREGDVIQSVHQVPVPQKLY